MAGAPRLSPRSGSRRPAIPRQESPPRGLCPGACRPRGTRLLYPEPAVSGFTAGSRGVPPSPQAQEGGVGAGFGPLQPRESSSACKGLRALPVAWEKMEDQGFCLLSTGLKSHFSPTCEEWVLALKCPPELRGPRSGSQVWVWEEAPVQRCGGSRERVAPSCETHQKLRENPEATGETEDREIQSLNYKPSGT